MRMKLGKPYHEVGFNNKYNSILRYYIHFLRTHKISFHHSAHLRPARVASKPFYWLAPEQLKN
jgi:hypothetical protein